MVKLFKIKDVFFSFLKSYDLESIYLHFKNQLK